MRIPIEETNRVERNMIINGWIRLAIKNVHYTYERRYIFMYVCIPAAFEQPNLWSTKSGRNLSGRVVAFPYIRYFCACAYTRARLCMCV